MHFERMLHSFLFIILYSCCASSNRHVVQNTSAFVTVKLSRLFCHRLITEWLK